MNFVFTLTRQLELTTRSICLAGHVMVEIPKSRSTLTSKGENRLATTCF